MKGIEIAAFCGVAKGGELRKGQRAYVEGTLSAGIWPPPDGSPKLDLSVKCSKLEPAQIGRNKPKRNSQS